MGKESGHSFVAGIASHYGMRLKRFFALRLRNGADAPDLAQEVFLRLLRIEHHESIRSPEAYLFTVASHVLYQHSMRQAINPPVLDLSEVFAELQIASGDDPLERAEGQQRLVKLERALAALPPMLSTTLLLHRVAGLSIQEIGVQLGVSRPTAKKYLARALILCRNLLEEDE